MSEKIKIGYFADGPWSHEAFNLLIQDKDIEIAFIVPRFDTRDVTLLNFSIEHNIEYLKHQNINSEEFLETISKYNCDLFVSMSFNQIFREKIINMPPMRTINCHAGKLPFYRGRNILNWALINDEKEFGITVHYIDKGIDTGDIILQRCYPITEQDDYGSLLKVAYNECANILYDAIKELQAGTAKITRQSDIHPVGFYCGVRGEGDEKLNWHQSSRDVFNFIRSICAPGPKARTSINGQEIQINRARMIENAPAYKNTIGQIVGKSPDGYIVKTLDSTIEIFEVESPVKLKVGDRLG